MSAAPDTNPLRPASTALVAPVRIAVVGCTLAHIRYAPVLKQLPSLNVVALVDSDLRLARGWAREIGKPAVFPDIDALLESEIDFQGALVSAPPALRSVAFTTLLRAGKSVVGDLPLSSLLSQTGALAELTSAAGAVLIPWLPRRFDPNFLAAAGLLASGAIGQVEQVRCVWSFPAGGWFAAEQGGDPENRRWSALLPQIACQTVDVATGTLGPAYAVSADIDNSSESIAAPAHRRHNEMIATIIVSHERGQSTHHFTRSRSVQPSEQYIFSGAAGSIELVIPPGEGTAAAPTVVTVVRPGQRPEPVQVDGTALSRTESLLGYFADRIRGDQIAQLDVRDGRSAQEIVSAAYLSARDNLKISLPLRRDADLASS